MSDVAALSPVAGEVAIETFTIMYMSRKSKKIILQEINMPAKSVKDKLYDAMLVAWAKIKNNVELDFLFTWDSEHRIVATRESLTYYTMRIALNANKEVVDSLEPLS